MVFSIFLTAKTLKRAVGKFPTIDTVFKKYHAFQYSIDTIFGKVYQYEVDTAFKKLTAQSKQYTVDAFFILLQETATTVDTVLKKLGRQETVTTDTVFKKVDIPTQYTEDTVFAVKDKQITYSNDTVLKKFSRQILFTIDVIIGIIGMVDSETEVIFDDTLRTEGGGPTYTKNVDLKGAKNLIIIQEATTQGTTARTKVSSQNWTSATAPIDDNLGSATAHVYCVAGFSGGSPQQAIFIIDFGSIAVRNISSKARVSMSCNSSGSGSRNVQANIEFSTDDISYSGGGQIVNANGAQSGGQDNTATRTDTGVNMRYARVYTTGTGGGVCNGNASLFEVWEDGTGLGTATLKFQIWDEIRSSWKDYIGTGEFPTMDSSGAGNQSITQIGHDVHGNTDPPTNQYLLPSFPVTPTPKFRAVLTLTDGCDGSVLMVKVI